MTLAARRWNDIAEPYRAESWAECARLVRMHVDQDPHDLPVRALFASLLVRSGQRAMALTQYERLLPLAVGQGDLFAALATQRALDDMHAPEQRHPERYRAIQQWFRSFAGAPPRRACRPGRHPGRMLRSGLLALPADLFTMIAEQTLVMPLDLAPQTHEDTEGLLWVPYFGRLRWTLSSAAGAPAAAGAADPGDVVQLPAGRREVRRLETVAECATSVLQFDPGVAGLIGQDQAPDAAAA
jgi:hypothetical protein